MQKCLVIACVGAGNARTNRLLFNRPRSVRGDSAWLFYGGANTFRLDGLR